MMPRYEPKFIPAPGIFFHALMDLHWLEIKNARKELFMSDVPRTYVYGNGDYEYHSQPFAMPVDTVLAMLSRARQYNVCFLNRYDTQHHALGWHADDSPNVDPDHPIAVVSFGAEREIWWKPIGFKGEIPKENRQVLGDGSLFEMPAGFQQQFMHKIPRHSRPCTPRISLTFRRYV